MTGTAEARDEPMLRVEHVSKAYGGLEALRDVSLTVARGEVVGLVGPNGAGKTSLVSIVAGLRRPDEGIVQIAGADVTTATRDKIGVLVGLAPQDLAVYPTVSVKANLTTFAELAGLRGSHRNTRIAETAEALGLTDLLPRQADSLSGGQKRRLHTAMALVHRPPLLLLDEPTVGADIESRAQLLHLVRSLADEGAAVVYSTHYLPEVEQLGATVAVIDRGRILARILARGPLAELIQQYAKAAVELIYADGTRELIPSDDPAETAAAALTRLGGDASRLTGLEILRPTLESVYLAVTGRRYDADEGADTSDVAHA